MNRSIWIVVALVLLASCAPPQHGGELQGPQVPSVLVNDAGRCRPARDVMFDPPAATVWSAGCR